MATAEWKNAAAEIERTCGAEFEQISHYIFEHPELGLKEFESSRYLAEYIRGKGFAVEMPYDGFDTAFCARSGSEGPTIAFLAEYDALPGYGPDKRNGHACGHNWIAAATAGAAVTLAELCRREHIKAQVLLIGTPAEETYCAKVRMADDHLLDHIDACLQPHLAADTCICPKALALNAIYVTYHGKAAHSAGAPWDGVNALDAVQLLYAGINALRQHVRPDVRIHGIITEGGQAANIVPDKASALFYVRASHRAYLDTVLEKVLNIARGAELMTGARLELVYPELPMDDLIDLPVLMELADKNLRAQSIVPTLDELGAAAVAGSTDIGNVSHVCPTLYFEVGLNSKSTFEAHQESALALADSPYAYERLHQVIRAMVGVSADLLADPALLRRAAEEFRQLSGR